jgi:trimeric autotransporter adhesin
MPTLSGRLQLFTVLLWIAYTMCVSQPSTIALAQDASPLVSPNGIVLLPDGNLLVSDIQLHQIFRVDPSGELHAWGGNGEAAYSGDAGPVSQAAFHAPSDLKLDASRNAILIADTNNHRIRRVNLNDGTVVTVAGNGRSEYSGDGGLATAAGLSGPQGIAVDAAGNVLIADTYNHVVRRIGTDGNIATVAGSEPGLSGDGGPATSAQMSLPMAVAFASDGHSFYVSDAGNCRIRFISYRGLQAQGNIDTVCGIGEGSGEGGAGFSGDGEVANRAKIFSALDIAAPSPNLLYLTDSGNNRLRAVVHGIILTLAGTGFPQAPKPDHDKRTAVELFVPAKMALAPDGRIFFCDRGNHCIRILFPDGKLEKLELRIAGPNSIREGSR